MKRIMLAIPSLVGILLLLSVTAFNPLEEILKKLQLFHKENPQQKLYVHLDKPFYAAGENIWFKAYLMEASLHTLDSQSRVVYAELINDEKIVFKRQMLYVSNGTAYGDFKLPDTLREGKYIFRAYTNYMRNVDEAFFFTKEFSLLNPVVKQLTENQESLSPDSLNLRFFPEGGNLVACGFNRMAFKATTPDGKSITVEGRITDEANTTVATFKTQHEGMGLVRFNPQQNKQYYAYITEPYGVNRVYPLPKIIPKGYVMQVDAVAKNIKVVVITNEDSKGEHIVNLVVQSRGKAYHAQQGVMKDNAFFVNIPKSKLPEGISQITLFDSEGRPVAERLIHVDQQERITVDIKTDTTLYGKRKLVTVHAQAKYANGTPAPANLSVSVYDDLLVQNQEKYPLSITSYLTLTSDLKGYIENPGYYFKDSLAETKRNLDLLMMVHGWRRFTWTDVLAADNEPPVYKHESGIPISGKVLKMGGKNPPAGSIVKVMTMDGKMAKVSPDSLGRFYVDNLLYYDSTTLVFQTENSKGKKHPYKFALNPLSIPLPPESTPTSFIKFDTRPYLKQRAEEKLVFDPKTVVIKDVEIVAKKERDPGLVGNPGLDKVLDITKTGTQYNDVMDLVQYKIPFAQVQGKMPDLFLTVRGAKVGYCLNGTPVDAGLATTIPVTSMKYVEVIRFPTYAHPCHINIVMNYGGLDRIPIGINKSRYPGFYQAREFYSPDYAVPNDRHKEADKRITLYWEPMMVADENGEAIVQFYTGDVSSRYRIVVEGITPDGYPGTSVSTFEVE